MAGSSNSIVNVPLLWREIATYKSHRKTLSGLQLLGVPERSHWDRLTRLANAKPARALFDKLAGCGPGELAHLLSLASVNAEQAETAFRRAFVVNISAPFAMIVAFAQIAPETFSSIITPLQQEGMTGLVIFALAAAVLFGIGYAYARAADARDLRDLLQMRMAAGATAAA